MERRFLSGARQSLCFHHDAFRTPASLTRTPEVGDHKSARCGGSLARKKKTFDAGKEVRAIARERVGPVPAGKPIEPKSVRKKPKHKKRIEDEAQ